MQKVNWEPNMEVWIGIIDEQHKMLIDMINEAYSYFMEWKELDIIDLEKKLWDYASYHFETEENLMNEISYPAKDEHLDEHFIFIWEISKIRWEWNDDEEIAMNVIRFLTEWLCNHIFKIDMKLWKYYKEKIKT